MTNPSIGLSYLAPNETSPVKQNSITRQLLEGAQHFSNFAVNVMDYGAKGDGATDDTNAFVNASATGKLIYVPAGTFMVQPLTNISGIVGASPELTTIKCNTPNTITFISNSSLDKSYYADLTLDFNTNFTTASSTDGGPINVLINFFQCTRPYVTNVTFLNWRDVGISYQNCSDGIISHCRVLRPATTHINLNTGILTTESTATGASVGHRILYNLLDKCAMEMTGANVVILGNESRNWGSGSGIVVDANANTSNVTVAYNSCHDSSGVDNNNDFLTGIEMWGRDSRVIGNVCYNCSGHGIFFGAASSLCVGNTCFNNGQSQTDAAGISIQMSTAGFNPSFSAFTGNNCYNTDGSTGSQHYGIYIGDGGITNLTIVANNLATNQSAIRLTTTTLGSNQNISDNSGYNPVGASQVTFASSLSPLSYTAGPSPETLYMSAATNITAIKRWTGDTLISATLGANVPATVDVDPTDQIQVTYSGTLTINKMIH